MLRSFPLYFEEVGSSSGHQCPTAATKASGCFELQISFHHLFNQLCISPFVQAGRQKLNAFILAQTELPFLPVCLVAGSVDWVKNGANPSIVWLQL